MVHSCLPRQGTVFINYYFVLSGGKLEGGGRIYLTFNSDYFMPMLDWIYCWSFKLSNSHHRIVLSP